MVGMAWFDQIEHPQHITHLQQQAAYTPQQFTFRIGADIAGIDFKQVRKDDVTAFSRSAATHDNLQ